VERKQRLPESIESNSTYFRRAHVSGAVFLIHELEIYVRMLSNWDGKSLLPDCPRYDRNLLGAGAVAGVLSGRRRDGIGKGCPQSTRDCFLLPTDERRVKEGHPAAALTKQEQSDDITRPSWGYA
jgi:hypothetical protein